MGVFEQCGVGAILGIPIFLRQPVMEIPSTDNLPWRGNFILQTLINYKMNSWVFSNQQFPNNAIRSEP